MLGANTLGFVACLASSGKTKEGGFGRPFSQSEKYLRLRLAAARRRREIHARTAYPHAKPNSSTTRSKSRPDIKHRPYALIRSLCIHCYRPGSQRARHPPRFATCGPRPCVTLVEGYPNSRQGAATSCCSSAARRSNPANWRWANYSIARG